MSLKIWRAVSGDVAPTEDLVEEQNMSAGARQAPDEYTITNDGQKVRLNRAGRRAKASIERKGEKSGEVRMGNLDAARRLRRNVR